MGLVLLAGGCLEADPRWKDPAGEGQDSGGTHTGATGATSGTGSGSDGTDGPSGSGGATGGGSTGSSATGSATGTGGTGTSSTATGSTSTTGGDPPGCSTLWAEPGWTLEEPVHLVDLTSDGFDGDPYLSADALTLYFASDRQGDPDVFVATRADLGSPFGNTVPLDDINTNDGEWTFAAAEDGLLAYFNTDRPGGTGDADLWQVTRDSIAEPWGNPSPISELNSDGPEWGAFTTPDGLTIYYVPTASGADCYRASRPSRTEPFGPGTPLSVNSPEADTAPTLSADGLLIVLASRRPGGLGNQSLWYATRPSIGAAFSTPQLLPVVNTEGQEGEPHLRYDACELLFASGSGGLSNYDLYSTRFVPP
jgi:hypothetical protein